MTNTFIPLQTVLGAIVPNLGIPLTFQSQLILRMVSEVTEAALMYKVLVLYGSIRPSMWAHLLARTLLSLSTGLVIDAIRRQAFLKSCLLISKALLMPDENQEEPNRLPVRPRLAKTYTSSLPSSKHITLKSSPHRIQVVEESIPSYNHAALARRIKAHHPETYKLYLRIREGCIVFDTVVCSTGKSSFEVLDLIENLHPESEMGSFESPMMLRAYVTGPTGAVTSCVYTHREGGWVKLQELDSSSSSCVTEAPKLNLDPVICLTSGERTKKLVGVWHGPPPPHGCSVEAVIHGRPLKVSCFPDPYSWSDGTEIKVTLFLDDLNPEYGGIVDINVWSPPLQRKAIPSLPEVLVVSSRMLLLPTGTDGAVHELTQMFSLAGGSPSQPWGDLGALVEEMSIIFWASSADALSLDPDLVPALRATAKAIVQWATDCQCPNVKQLAIKAMKSIKMNRLLFALSPFTLSGPWQSYPPAAAWISLFGTALTAGSVKWLLSDGVELAYAPNSLIVWPYLVCILLQLVASRQSSGLIVEMSRRCLLHAGIFLFMSKMLLGLLILSPHFSLSPHARLEHIYGDLTAFTLMYLSTKTCYSIFERFDLRAFVLLVLGIDTPLVIATMKNKVNCTMATSVTFGVATNIYCIVIRVLYDRWCAKQVKLKSKNVFAFRHL